jgi:hypothetical protein
MTQQVQRPAFQREQICPGNLPGFDLHYNIALAYNIAVSKLKSKLKIVGGNLQKALQADSAMLGKCEGRIGIRSRAQ